MGIASVDEVKFFFLHGHFENKVILEKCEGENKMTPVMEFPSDSFDADKFPEVLEKCKEIVGEGSVIEIESLTDSKKIMVSV